MKKLFSFKRLFLGFRIYSYEFIYIVNVWLYYLCFRYLHKHDEPKHYFFEFFKDNNEYTQICFNQTYKIQTEHYEHFHKRLFKLVKIPYRYFQLFSDKNQNKRTGDSNRFFPKNAPTKVINIAPHTYYEGIEFNNFFFDSFEIDNLCFHNCTFRNCKFSNMTSKKFLWESELKQGFSSCDFYNCTFEKCNFKNLFFSIGNIDLTTFSDVTFFNCIFHRMSFQKVIFTGSTTFNNTSIYSPSKAFDLSFMGSIDNIHVDAQCHVTAFSYYDRANFTLEKWMQRKKLRFSNSNKIADTYFALDQIWTSNHIREEDNSYANFYYQRKKAETRNRKKPSKIIGYLSEWVIGYGEKPYNALLSMALIIIFFSFIYMFTGFIPEIANDEIKYNIKQIFNTPCIPLLSDFFQSLYYSFFTMITVGQGNARPFSPESQIAMSIELLLGAIMMTLFTSTLFRKYTK